MKLEVHIKDKIFTLHCGEGKQKIRWVADASVVRYEHFFGGTCPVPLAIRTEDGKQLDFEATIKDTLSENTNVWVLFKQDLQALGIYNKAKKRPDTASNSYALSP